MYKFLLLKLKMPIWVNSIKIPSGPEAPWGILMAETREDERHVRLMCHASKLSSGSLLEVLAGTRTHTVGPLI